jgi:TRAP-type uncharacterized transport system substrate-binding protein
MQPGGFQRAPVIMRSKLMLEVASELVSSPGWADRQVLVDFREQGAPEWRLAFFASDAPNSVDAVASGEADFAICNPGGVLAMALHGLGPYQQPVPVRAVMVFPQLDRLGFAVDRRVGISSLAEIKERRLPLKVSLRGQRDHSVHMIIDQVLASYGFSLHDIEQWGGELHYTPGLPGAPGRLDAVESGKIDIVIDEAFGGLARGALDLGLQLLPVDEPQLKELDRIGLRRSRVTKEEFPGLEQDFDTIDFSGWPAFCLESTPDDLVTHFCAALEARKANIPWYGSGPMDLKLMVSDTPEAPMAIPLHPAAEGFWRQQGYL